MDWSELLLWLFASLPLVRLLLKRFVYFPRYLRVPDESAETPTQSTPPHKVVLVTGGNKGIGEALVRLLLKDRILGARTVQRVVVVARDSEAVKYKLLPGLITQIESATKQLDEKIRESADQFVVSLQNGNWDQQGNFVSTHLVFVKLDLSLYDDLKSIVPLLKKFGVIRLDAVVFNAGTISDSSTKLGSKNIEAVAVMNLVSPLLLTKILKPFLVADSLLAYNCGSAAPYSFSSATYSPTDDPFESLALSPKPKDYIVLKQYFNTKALLRLAITRAELRQTLMGEAPPSLKMVAWDPGFTRHLLGSSKTVFPWSKPLNPQTPSPPTKGLLLRLLELLLLPFRYGLCRDSDEAAARLGEFVLDYLCDEGVRTRVLSGETGGPGAWTGEGIKGERTEAEVFGRLRGEDGAVRLLAKVLRSELFAKVD